MYKTGAVSQTAKQPAHIKISLAPDLTPLSFCQRSQTFRTYTVKLQHGATAHQYLWQCIKGNSKSKY